MSDDELTIPVADLFARVYHEFGQYSEEAEFLHHYFEERPEDEESLISTREFYLILDAVYDIEEEWNVFEEQDDEDKDEEE